jgi:hypothetical protein
MATITALVVLKLLTLQSGGVVKIILAQVSNVISIPKRKYLQK